MGLENDTVIKERYRILKLLGKGAMGQVYHARDLNEHRTVVIKEFDLQEMAGLKEDDAKDLFLKELEFLKKFNHPGLPEFYEYFSLDSGQYIVMEFIDGKTLEEIIDSSKNPVNKEKAVKWAIELADILDYLHNSFHKPVVYRDLKPANIIITYANKARLIDFGISRYYDPDKHTDTLRLGSPGYAAPEQYKGRGQTGPQADIFSLGVILFQLLTGYDPTERPFKFPVLKELNPGVSDELSKIVEKAINLKPLNRYISARDFKDTLEKYVRHRPATPVNPPAPVVMGSTDFFETLPPFRASFYSFLYSIILVVFSGGICSLMEGCTFQEGIYTVCWIYGITVYLCTVVYAKFLSIMNSGGKINPYVITGIGTFVLIMLGFIISVLEILVHLLK